MHSSLRALSLRRSVVLSVCLLAAALPLSAQEVPAAPAPAPAATPAPALKSLALGKIKASPALVANATAHARKNSLERMSQAFDGQLLAALQQTRKFTVLARSDADALIEENAAAGQTFAFGDSELTLVVSIDDFQDFTQTATFQTLGKTATKRVIRFSAVAKLYETKTNKLVETANFQEQNLDTEEELANSSSSGGELSDSLLVALTRRMSEQIAQRVADVAFPARIVARTGKVVTINRGEGTGIAAGQLWEVFALGEELVDPDTGASLGREEVSVGRVRVQRVNARMSQAEISGEDLGVDRGAIVRRVQQ
jgi:curli biogenesis system outer membrane secretion channel CsgG